MEKELFEKIEMDLENGMGYCESFRSLGFKKEEFGWLLEDFKKMEIEVFGWSEEEDILEFSEEDRDLLNNYYNK